MVCALEDTVPWFIWRVFLRGDYCRFGHACACQVVVIDCHDPCCVNSSHVYIVDSKAILLF